MRNFSSSHKSSHSRSYQKQRSVCLPIGPSATTTTTQTTTTTTLNAMENNDSVNNNNRLSWPQFRNVNQVHVNISPGAKCYVLREDLEPNSNNRTLKRDMHTPLERVLPKDEASVMERANQIVM